MKNILFIVCFPLLFFSCRDLAFTEPQPAGAQNEYTFPANLQGLYVSKYNKDTLRITANTFGNDPEERLNNNMFIRRSGKYLILNNKDSLHWHLSIICPRNANSFAVYGFDMGDQKKRKKINELLSVQEIKDENGRVEYYLAQPNERQFQELLSRRYWSKLETFQRVK